MGDKACKQKELFPSVSELEIDLLAVFYFLAQATALHFILL